jgi:hypothetical protein
MSEPQLTTPPLQPNPSPQFVPVAFPWWLQAMVVLGALLMLTGAILAVIRPEAILSPHEGMKSAVRIYAGYLGSRNGALAILLLAALFLRARGMLSTLMLLTGVIQILDFILDCLEGRWALLPGILVFAILYFTGARVLSGAPFWKLRAWKQTP